MPCPVGQAVLLRQFGDFAFLRAAYSADDQILIRRKPEVSAVDLGNLPQAGHQLIAILILDPPALNVERQIPFAVKTLHPAVTVAVVVKMILPGSFQLPAEAVSQLSPEPVQPVAVNGVFEPGVLADGTVAVVTLDRYRLLGHIDDLLWPDKADYPSKLRISGRIAVGHPHSPAYRHIEAGQLAVFENRDEAQVL
ncbi:hypothetical protein D3C73_1203290 [compost metagenome]